MTKKKTRLASPQLSELRQIRARLKQELAACEWNIKRELERLKYPTPREVMLYALRLEGNNYYVGMSYNVERRFASHVKGKGAAWTKRHRPLEIQETRPTGKFIQDEVAKLEDDMTLEYALKYGSDRVRGGGWCQAHPLWPDVVVENDLAGRY